LLHILPEPGRDACAAGQVPADRSGGQVEDRQRDQLDSPPGRPSLQPPGQCAVRLLDRPVEVLERRREIAGNLRVQKVLAPHGQQQARVCGLAAGEVDDGTGHGGTRLDRVVPVGGGQVTVLEAPDRSDPQLHEQPVARAEAVIERPGRGAARTGDRSHRRRAWPSLEHEGRRRVEHGVSRMDGRSWHEADRTRTSYLGQTLR